MSAECKGQNGKRIPVQQLEVPLESSTFLKQLITEMTATLEDVVGVDEASGLISLVGNTIGRDIQRNYAEQLQQDRLPFAIIPEILVDIKRRIGGDFRLESLTSQRIVLVNGRCPFGQAVEGKPSLCMMTSNVFGRVVADNLGYARVVLEETIAQGAGGCRIIIDLTPTPMSKEGREYFSYSEL